MDSLNFSCRGESHIATGRVCQDYSFSKVYPSGNAIAIVCDGHGGKRYFRSDVGARIAGEVTEQAVSTFIEEAGPLLPKNSPCVQRGTISEQISKRDFHKTDSLQRAFRQLFGAIIYRWNARIAAHAATNPITVAEREDLEERWVEEFERGENLEKSYGCTLIVYAATSRFRFAFQIGDGKCFACDQDGKWSQPIPWDERCFLNKTTSICDCGAIDEFRYYYAASGTAPIAVILGSDGIDDSFGIEENQANFYVQILKSVARLGVEATKHEIESTLPQLSKMGSRDDMSIAMVFNTERVKAALPLLIEWQIAGVEKLIAEENARIDKARATLETLHAIAKPGRQDEINLRYAQADESRATASLAKLSERLESLTKELAETEPASATDNESE